jgi:hypothetical protein
MGKSVFQEGHKGKTVERNPLVDLGFLNGGGDANYVPD